MDKPKINTIMKENEFVEIQFLDQQEMNNGSVPTKRQDSFEIIFFKNTDGLEHFVDFLPHRTQKGDVFIVQPGQVHYFKSTMGQSYEMIILSFSNELKEELSQDEMVRNFFDNLEYQSIVFNFDDCRSKDLDYCLWQLEYEIVVRPQYWDKMILHLIRLLITYLSRDGAEKGVMPKMSDSLRMNYQFKKMVEGHFAHHLDIAQYADMMNLSLNELRTLTQNTMQILPEKYLQWRLNLEAKRLLFYQKNSLQEISSILGFSHLDQFTSFFLDNNNTSPLAFQKEMKSR